MSNSIINQIITNVIGTATQIITLLFVVALLVFAWGIVKLIAAAGSPEKLKNAKGILWWGVIGMAVLGSVFGLVLFLQNYFGVKGNAPVQVPQFVPIPAGGSGNNNSLNPNLPDWGPNGP